MDQAVGEAPFRTKNVLDPHRNMLRRASFVSLARALGPHPTRDLTVPWLFSILARMRDIQPTDVGEITDVCARCAAVFAELDWGEVRLACDLFEEVLTKLATFHRAGPLPAALLAQVVASYDASTSQVGRQLTLAHILLMEYASRPKMDASLDRFVLPLVQGQVYTRPDTSVGGVSRQMVAQFFLQASRFLVRTHQLDLASVYASSANTMVPTKSEDASEYAQTAHLVSLAASGAYPYKPRPVAADRPASVSVSRPMRGQQGPSDSDGMATWKKLSKEVQWASRSLHKAELGTTQGDGATQDSLVESGAALQEQAQKIKAQLQEFGHSKLLAGMQLEPLRKHLELTPYLAHATVMLRVLKRGRFADLLPGVSAPHARDLSLALIKRGVPMRISACDSDVFERYTGADLAELYTWLSRLTAVGSLSLHPQQPREQPDLRREGLDIEETELEEPEDYEMDFTD